MEHAKTTGELAKRWKMGYLTACPSNVGTGMRASVMLHLPGLCLTEEIKPVVNAVSKIGLAVRGLWGEGSEAAGHMFQISNQITLGKTEIEIVSHLDQIVLEVIEHEKNARLRLMETQEIREKYNIGVEGEAGAKGQIGIPYLQSFFYKFKMSAKSSRSLKETIKTNIEPKLSDLIEHCNLLITEISLSLLQINKKGLLIIIEDLDKIPVDRAEDMFFNYANQITQLKTNIVFTMNARSLLNFFEHRLCLRAQWEIRELAGKMLELVKPVAPNIFKFAGGLVEFFVFNIK